MNNTTGGPAPYLRGIRVLDFTQYLAGPSCTRLMAELGADVIKVEMAPSGDPTRTRVPERDGRAGVFLQQNRGKRSVCVDLRRPEGLDLVKSLVAHVDIVIENYTPGVMARRGLGYDDLRALNPKIIMVSVSGFGQTGPLSHKRSFDFIAQGVSGMMHMTGEPDGPPMFVGVGVGDTNAGVHAFAAIGYALFNRDRTGEGAHVDIAMVDALFHMHEYAAMATSMTDGEFVPHRQGRHYQPAAPAGTFKGPEGWIVLLCTEQQVRALWDAMGRPELADDHRFASNPDRVAHRDELTAEIETWMATFATDAEVLAALEAHKVPSGPVLSPADAIDHPHFRARRMVRETSDPFAGTFTIPGFPIKFSDAPPEPNLVAPTLGEHNSAVLGELLGLDDDVVAALESDGIVTRGPR